MVFKFCKRRRSFAFLHTDAESLERLEKRGFDGIGSRRSQGRKGEEGWRNSVKRNIVIVKVKVWRSLMF